MAQPRHPDTADGAEGEVRVRATGFQRPFHPCQVVSWIVFGSDVLIYLVCMFALLDDDTKLVLAPFYFLSVLVLVAATFKATTCNAADPNVLLHDSAGDQIHEAGENIPFCGLCNVFVHNRSKHCRVCNKCVDVFDHHCIWINNCVGRANYRSFFATICAVVAMIGMILGTCTFLLFLYFHDRESFEQRLRDAGWVNDAPGEVFLVLLAFLGVVNVPLFVLDMQLVVLHLFLMSQGFTTYEYIVAKRDGPDEGKGGAPSRRTLPRCMDWIVFSRCGQRRRRRPPPPEPSEGITATEVAWSVESIEDDGDFVAEPNEDLVAAKIDSPWVVEAAGEPLPVAAAAAAAAERCPAPERAPVPRWPPEPEAVRRDPLGPCCVVLGAPEDRLVDDDAALKDRDPQCPVCCTPMGR